MGNIQENTTNAFELIEDEIILDFDSVFLGGHPEGNQGSDLRLQEYIEDEPNNFIFQQSVYDIFDSPIGDDIVYEFYSQSDQLFIEEQSIIDSVLYFDYTFNDFETKFYPKVNWVKQQPATDGWVKLQEVT